MIEPLDALEELNEGTRILIYPCINLLLMREDIKKLLAVFGEEAGQDVAVTEKYPRRMRRPQRKKENRKWRIIIRHSRRSPGSS